MCKLSILGLLVVRYFWRKKVYRALFFAKFGLNLKIVRYWLGGIKHTACIYKQKAFLLISDETSLAFQPRAHVLATCQWTKRFLFLQQANKVKRQIHCQPVGIKFFCSVHLSTNWTSFFRCKQQEKLEIPKRPQLPIITIGDWEKMKDHPQN